MIDAGIPWSVIGPIATLVGALIGIGVGWGAMRSMVASLKTEVINFKEIAEEIRGKVVALETHNGHNQSTIHELVRRVGDLEIDVSALKVKLPRTRRS